MSFKNDCLNVFRSDLEAWAERGWAKSPVGWRSGALLVFRFAGVRACLLHRLAYWLRMHHVPALPTLLGGINIGMHGFDIPAHVTAGPGLYVPHPVGVVITAERIGRNVEIQSCVTIGMRNTPSYPVIEDGASLGTGCKVLGSITVGRGARIGANAVVVSDVPCETTMVGIPARAIGATAKQPAASS